VKNYVILLNFLQSFLQDYHRKNQLLDRICDTADFELVLLGCLIRAMENIFQCSGSQNQMECPCGLEDYQHEFKLLIRAY